MDRRPKDQNELGLRTLSVIGFVAMAVSVVSLGMTRSLFSLSPVALCLQAGAAALLLWARAAFGRRSYHVAAGPTAGGLMTTGPYHFVRHPIYTATCLFVFASVITHWSVRTIALYLLLLLGVCVRMLCEERLVSERYPEYRRYAERTKRMIPYLF